MSNLTEKYKALRPLVSRVNVHDGETFCDAMKEALSLGLGDDIFHHTGFHPSVLQFNQEYVNDPSVAPCFNLPHPGVWESVAAFCRAQAGEDRIGVSDLLFRSKDGTVIRSCFNDVMQGAVLANDTMVGRVQRLVMGVAVLNNKAEVIREVMFGPGADEEVVALFHKAGFHISRLKID